MHIKNKFLRLLVSVIMALFIYWILVFILTQGNEVLDGMLMFALFGILLVLPLLIFITYMSYILLTAKENRPSKKIIRRATKIISIIIGLFLIVAFLGMYTDVLD